MLLGAWPVPMPQNRQDVAVVVMVSENVQFGRPCCSVLPMLVAIAVVSRRTFRVTRTGSVESVVRFGSFEEEGSIDFYGQSGAYCGLASLATCASFAIGPEQQRFPGVRTTSGASPYGGQRSMLGQPWQAQIGY